MSFPIRIQCQFSASSHHFLIHCEASMASVVGARLSPPLVRNWGQTWAVCEIVPAVRHSALPNIKLNVSNPTYQTPRRRLVVLLSLRKHNRLNFLAAVRGTHDPISEDDPYWDPNSVPTTDDSFCIAAYYRSLQIIKVLFFFPPLE